MKTKEDLISYLESEINECIKKQQFYVETMRKESVFTTNGINLKYVVASEMNNLFEGQRIALDRLLKELTK